VKDLKEMKTWRFRSERICERRRFIGKKCARFIFIH